MEVFFSGDWYQATYIIDGLKASQRFAEALSAGGHLRWAVVLFSFFGFLYYLGQALQKKCNLEIPFMYLLFVPFWLSFGLNNPVDIRVGSAPFESPLESEKATLQLKIKSLQSQIAKSASADLLHEGQNLKEAKVRLRLVNDMLAAKETKLGQAPLPVAYLYQLSNAIGLGVWAILEDVKPEELASRRSQALILNNLSTQTDLSPGERAAAAQVSNCLSAKGEFLALIDIDKKEALNGRELGKNLETYAGAAAHNLMSGRQVVKKACNNVSKNLMTEVDKSISEEDIKAYNASWQLPKWLPWLGGRVITNKGQQEKVDFIATQLNLSTDELKKMSEDEISKSFIRQKKLNAMVDEWIDGGLDDFGTPPTRMSQSGFKATAGGFMADWMGGFALSIKPFIHLIISWSWRLALISGPIMILIALLPKHHFSAPAGYAFALLFLSLWQVVVNDIELYSSRQEARRINVSVPATGVGNKLSKFMVGGWEELTGDFEVADVVAGAAVAGKPAIKAGFWVGGLQKIKTIFASIPKASPQTAVLSGVGVGLATVGYAGFQANERIKIEEGSYEELVHAAATGLNPGLEALYGGYLGRQRTIIEDARSHSAMLESILLLASPIIVLIFFMGGYKMISSLGVGAAAGAAGSAVANTIGGAAVSKLGGMGGRTGGGK